MSFCWCFIHSDVELASAMQFSYSFLNIKEIQTGFVRVQQKLMGAQKRVHENHSRSRRCSVFHETVDRIYLRFEAYVPIADHLIWIHQSRSESKREPPTVVNNATYLTTFWALVPCAFIRFWKVIDAELTLVFLVGGNRFQSFWCALSPSQSVSIRLNHNYKEQRHCDRNEQSQRESMLIRWLMIETLYRGVDETGGTNWRMVRKFYRCWKSHRLLRTSDCYTITKNSNPSFSKYSWFLRKV